MWGSVVHRQPIFTKLDVTRLSSLKPHTYFLFVQDLHGVELVCFFMFDQHNSAERASAQSLEPIKIIQACCALRKHVQVRKRTDD